MRSSRSRRARACAALALLLALGAALLGARETQAGKIQINADGLYYVDGANPVASDANPGTADLPYRTILAAVKAHAGPGSSVLVRPGIYREQVTVPGSGSADLPFVIRATGPGTTIDGADDLSAPGSWTAVANGVYLAASVTWSPLQVMANGARLTASTEAPAAIPPGSFEYVAGSGLYLNLGGGNPGARSILVGRRSSAFVMNGKSWVTVQGFTIARTESYAILIAGSDHCTAASDTISYSNGHGVSLSSSTGVRVENCRISYGNNHGIYLNGGAGCVVRGCESFGNARPTTRSANGIYVAASTGNRIENNNLHDNQDTGLNLYTGANDNWVIGNRSWLNGDHGFDNLGATGNVFIDDVAYQNYKDGWSIEGGSSGTQIHDCIGIDNGMTTKEFNLWVDGSSTVGFVSDYNLFWNSTLGAWPVKWVTTRYLSVALYSGASGQDTHTLEADPRFVNARGGDFHLLAGSPAIDAALTSLPDWPGLDVEGHARLDDPSTPNRGAGALSFADIGVYEYQPVDGAPVVTAPGAVSVVAGQTATVYVAVSDPDGNPIAALAADLSSLPPGSSASFSPNANHTGGTFAWTPPAGAARSAPYLVTFTATNALSGSATTAITVTAPPAGPVNLCGNGTFEMDLRGWNGASGATVTRVAGGRDGGYAAQVRGAATGTAAMGLNDSPNWITATEGAGTRLRYSAWVMSTAPGGQMRLKVREYTPAGVQVGSIVQSVPVPLTTSWQQLTLDVVVNGAGNTLDFQVLDQPLAPAETFLVDDVSILDVTMPIARQSGHAASAPAAGLAFGARWAPNPTRWPARLGFTTTRAGQVRVRLYDTQGRLVRNLLDSERFEAGEHELAVDGTGRGRLGPGIYYYRLEAAEGIRQGRLVVLP